jgi:hypothetical protein
MPKLQFTLHDTGGRKSERGRWSILFNLPKPVVLFFASLSDYDQVGLDEKKTNALFESLDCFEDTMERHLYNIPFVLIFTKKDLFEKKFDKLPFNNYFPEWKGTTRAEAYQFFEDMYLKRLSVNPSRQYRVLFVNTTDLKDDFLEQLSKAIIVLRLTQAAWM